MTKQKRTQARGLREEDHSQSVPRRGKAIVRPNQTDQHLEAKTSSVQELVKRLEAENELLRQFFGISKKKEGET